VITSLIFGEALGIKINLLMFFLIGALGMLLLVRKGLDLPWHAAVFAALAYCFSSWWASRVEWGFYFKFYFHLFPILFYFYIRAGKNHRYLILSAMILTVAVTQLGLGFVVIFLFLFCYELIDYFSTFRKTKTPVFLGRLLLLALLVLALGAVRILPMARLVSENPRKVGSYETYTESKHPFPDFYKGPGHFAKALTGYDPTPNYPIHPGWGVLLLALIGAVGAFRKSWRFVLLTLLFAWFAFGPFALIDIWRLLFALPMFGSMHQPYQLTNYFILFGIVVLAAYAFALLERFSGRAVMAALSFLPLLFLIQPWIDNRPVYEKTFTNKAPRLEKEADFYQVKGRNQGRGAPRTLHSHQYFNALRNVGTIDWDGDVLLPENAVPKMTVDHEDNIFQNTGYKGEAFLVKGHGTLIPMPVTPNRIEVMVNAAAPDRLVINQNYAEGWRASSGFPVEARGGLLTVPIIKVGISNVVLTYRPKHFILTLWISIVFWLGSAFYLFSTRRS
jgi:hypothetical protein